MRLAIALLLGLCLAACSTDEEQQSETASFYGAERFLNDPADLDRKTQAIDSLVRLRAVRAGFNGAVLVAHRGHVLYNKAFGINSLREKDSLTTQSVFELASVSKQFTAVAVLQLYEQGKLDIDADLTSWWPNFPHAGITPRLLLSHRGGLSNYMYDLDERYRNRTDYIDNQKVLEEIISNRFTPFFPPNRRYDYSNTGYVLLACLVEKVSGQRFSDYAQRFLFRPAGMKDSFVFDSRKPGRLEEALIGHSGYFNPITRQYYFNGVNGDKGVYSTVEDLYRWEQALFRYKLLKPQTLMLALSPHNPDKRRGANYGFGWRVYQHEKGFQVNFHMGWWRGFKSLLVHLPHDESCIIVLSNKTSGAYSLRKEDILELLYGKADTGTDAEEGEE